MSDGRLVSVLVWGDAKPELVFLHGGGQNAHTWDSVALALDRPLVAIDLPGHGRSSWRDDRDYWPWANAEAVAAVMEELGAVPDGVVGMSLGGLTTLRLAATRPDLVKKAVIVDVSPGVGARTPTMSSTQRGATALIQGPRHYSSFEEMVAAAAAASGRDREGVWRGVRHNARQLEDGSWAWRYDQLRGPDDSPVDFTPLWDDVAKIKVQLALVRGGHSAHVHDDDVKEYRNRQPAVRVTVIDGAGHSVQGDRPVMLAQVIEDFVFGLSR